MMLNADAAPEIDSTKPRHVTHASDIDAPRTMRCLEVRGGNAAINQAVAMPGLDAWLYSRPHGGDAAGGDIHYVTSCAAGLLTRVLVADVCGHGNSVAETATALRSLMRRYINYIDQTTLVEHLNTEFACLSKEGCFATAVAATYFAHNDSLTVSNAGHPQPLWYNARRGEWCALHGFEEHGLANTPLGLINTRYDEVRMKFRPGDVLLMYTDSLIEASDRRGHMLGVGGLLEVVRTLDPSTPDRLINDVLDGVRARNRARVGEQDDVTMLVLRANGVRPRATWTLEAKAVTLLLREAVARWRGDTDVFPWPDAGPLALMRAFVQRIHQHWGARDGVQAHSRITPRESH